MVAEKDSDRGLQWVLGSTPPERRVVERGERIKLTRIADQEVRGRDGGRGVVASGVGLVGLVDD